MAHVIRSGMIIACLASALSLAAIAQPSTGRSVKPSRAPAPKCAWEQITDAAVGLQAWVQRCNYGFRKVDFLFNDKSLVIRYSDGGPPDPLVDVLDLLPGERAEAGIRRIFLAHTDAAIAQRCVVAPYRGTGTRTLAGVKRYTFVPNAAYRKELKAKSSPDEVGDPACGDWGDAPDGIQYFEAHLKSAARKVLFVRIGQDEPLFDEQTLRLLEGAK